MKVGRLGLLTGQLSSGQKQTITNRVATSTRNRARAGRLSITLPTVDCFSNLNEDDIDQQIDTKGKMSRVR